jgi:hypothetical protein
MMLVVWPLPTDTKGGAFSSGKDRYTRFHDPRRPVSKSRMLARQTQRAYTRQIGGSKAALSAVASSGRLRRLPSCAWERSIAAEARLESTPMRVQEAFL